MKVRCDHLSQSLNKSLSPVYLISGDEPLQLGEALDLIRSKAKESGYLNREMVYIETGHEWSQLRNHTMNYTIFSDQSLFDVRLAGEGKIGADGSRFITEYCQNPPSDTLLLLSCGKVDAQMQRSQWFQAIDKIGVVVQVWPLQIHELSGWVERRAALKQITFSADALRMLVGRIEGNLLAASQEIEKLYLLYGACQMTVPMIETLVSDSARFDVFKLTDALLLGKFNRAIKILNGLKAEGVAAPVVLWAISREIRLLSTLMKSGFSDAIIKKYQIFDKRKPTLQEALRRLSPDTIRNLLFLCVKVDQQIKGQGAGDSWEGLFTLCHLFAGTVSRRS